MLLEICFWCLAAFVVYTYAGYPVLLLLAARLWERPVRRGGGGPLPSVSVVLAVYNEGENIGRRLQELTGLIETTGVRGEVIVVSDGSEDASAAVARSFDPTRVRVLELPHNCGKAVALTHGCRLASHDVLVFADARQTWAPDALRMLLENFADPTVGAATGDLVVESKPGVMAGVGLYWRFEKLIRRAESRLYSTVGATGAISAVRRELFRPIPPGTLLDDVYWPLHVAMQQYRVIHDSQAKAYDRLPDRVRDEYCRKVRTLTGNFQLAALVPAALVPWRNPIWWQYLSHKLFRLAVPWALLALLALSAVTPGVVYAAAFWAQLAFYGLAVLGLSRLGLKLRLASIAGSFVVLNATAWLAFWEWSMGRTAIAWSKVPYEPMPVPVPPTAPLPFTAGRGSRPTVFPGEPNR